MNTLNYVCLKIYSVLMIMAVAGVPDTATAFQTQRFVVYGTVQDENSAPVFNADLVLVSSDMLAEADDYVLGAPIAQTNEIGAYEITLPGPGSYMVAVFYPGKEVAQKEIEILSKALQVDFRLVDLTEELEEITIGVERSGYFGMQRLRGVERDALYAAKKNEVVVLEDIAANLATNNSRQIFAKIPGLNIWESDGAGIQLGIGGRGLSPHRNSNFNTRQNGYDIAADALGYPESYYTPPAQALKRIEVVRGAASLQYGTQFGGLLNFVMKDGAEDKPFTFSSSQTLGSFGLFNSFNSVSGSTEKVRYYGYYQYKHSDGWRPNEGLTQHTAYLSTWFKLTDAWSIKPEFTYMTYLGSATRWVDRCTICFGSQAVAPRTKLV